MISKSKVILWIVLIVVFFISDVHADDSGDKSVYEGLPINQEQPESDQGTIPAPAPQEEQVDPLITEGPKITAWDFFKMIFALMFVLLLMYFILKFVNKRNKLFSQQRFMENLGGTSLGTNRSLQLVKVGNEILVLGVGESITLLKEINNEDEVNEIVDEFNNQDQIVQPINILKKLTGKQTSEHENKGNDQFITLLKEQLSDLSDNRKKIMQQFEKKGTKKE
ncbi:flagellar biosynthetic protein FliO [Bacillus sp. PS06]|uniref:flagellar biosynthetic protein FliO n=1 Tax=Bacillus sp. PS06 TaxID=2764176 RepID=UPI00177DCB6A|nr:flagellar biosynthetic protein FliO [Bacillus sp. PS06]MBD8068287.1 flagellar biosynthetic protein FliO [Bacillus sp. PS06]